MSTQEFLFILKQSFNNLINKYLEGKSANRCHKTFILQPDYDLIVTLRVLGTETNPNTQIIIVTKNENGLDHQQDIIDEKTLPDNFFEDFNNSDDDFEPEPSASNQLEPLMSNQPEPLIMNQLEPSTLDQPKPSTSDQPKPSISDQLESSTSNQTEPSTLNHSKPSTLNHSEPSMSHFETSMLNYSEPSMVNQSELLMSSQSESSIISKIDRNSIDWHTLPCKIIGELPNKTYHLQCKNGIINTTYCTNELIPLGLTEYEELNVCQDDVISVCEVARMQLMSTMTGTKYNCKGECKNNSCKCKCLNVVCGCGCHPHNVKCIN
ncbi:22622_t:CDS:2, partial [Cetraspora pellucida]